MRISRAGSEAVRPGRAPPSPKLASRIGLPRSAILTLLGLMTEDQCRELNGRFPAPKIQRLDPDGDIEDPSGKDLAVFLSVAACMQGVVRRLIRRDGRGIRRILNQVD